MVGEELTALVQELQDRLAKIEAHFKFPEPDPVKVPTGDGGDVVLIPGKSGIGADGEPGRRGYVFMEDLPTRDPEIRGAIWEWDGAVRVSDGVPKEGLWFTAGGGFRRDARTRDDYDCGLRPGNDHLSPQTPHLFPREPR